MVLRSGRLRRVFHQERLGLEVACARPAGASVLNAGTWRNFTARVAVVASNEGQTRGSWKIATQIQRPKTQRGREFGNDGSDARKGEGVEPRWRLILGLFSRYQFAQNYDRLHGVFDTAICWCSAGCGIPIIVSQDHPGVIYLLTALSHSFFTIAGVGNPIGIAQACYSIQLLGNICSWFLVERVGRRPLIVWGTIAMTALLLVIGGLGVPKSNQSALTAMVALMALWGFIVSQVKTGIIRHSFSFDADDWCLVPTFDWCCWVCRRWRNCISPSSSKDLLY